MLWVLPRVWSWVSCPLKASFSRLLAEELPPFRDSRGLTASSPDALMAALVTLIMQDDDALRQAIGFLLPKALLSHG